MANEFKIKKGLIVTGASGGTVVDIQGSQGQLFSVTDDLSGSIFAVSDISGVPIFEVDASGESTFSGDTRFNERVRIGDVSGLSNRGTVRIDTRGDAPADLLFGRDTAGTATGWNNVFWSISSRGSSEGNTFKIYRGIAHSSPYNSEAVPFTISPNLSATFASNVSITGNVSAGNLSGTNTGDQVLPTDFVSAANGGTFSGKIRVDVPGVALGSQPLIVAEFDGTDTDGLALISVDHTTRNTAAALGAGIRFKTGDGSSGSSNKFGYIFMQGGNNSDVKYIAPRTHTFYVDGHDDDLTGVNYNDYGTQALILNEDGTATFSGDISASNLSGTNTGDQTLASLGAAAAVHNHDSDYVNVTGDTMTGQLEIALASNQLKLSTGTAGDGYLNIGHFSNGTFIGTYGDDGGVADIIRFGTHSGDERMRITSGGDVALYETLQFFDDSSTPSASAFIHRPTSNTLALGTNSSERIRIDSNGNVGISITAPSQRLQVDSKVTGYNQGVPSTSGTNQNGILRLTPGDLTYGETLDFGMNVVPTYAWIQSTNKDSLSTNYNLSLNPNGGNVGIGTTSPAQELHINDATGNSLIRFSGGAANNETYDIGQGITAISNGGFGFYNLAESKYAMVFQDATCNVGIGTSTPNAKLDVQGSQGQLFSVTDDLSGDIFSVADISGVPIMNVNSDGTSYFDGNVSITGNISAANLGTAASSAATDFVAVTGDTMTGQLSINKTGSSQIAVNSRAYFGTHYDNNDVWIYGGPGDNILLGGGIGNIQNDVNVGNGDLIVPNGDVGIGTTDPDSKLHVKEGNITIEGYNTSRYLRFVEPDGSFQGGYVNYDGVSNILKIGVHNANDTNTVNDTNAISIPRSSGDVGIGTDSPRGKLDVNSGEVYVTTPNGMDALKISDADVKIGDYDDANGYAFLHLDTEFKFTTDSTEAMRIAQNGKVGIGTTAPGSRLDVKSPTGDGVDIFRVLSATTGSSIFRVYATTGVGGGLASVFDQTGAEKVRLYSTGDSYFNGGNVGIGETNPGKKLQINSTSAGEYDGGNSSNAGGTHLLLKSDGDTSRTLMSGPSIVFATPANTDGTNVWATSRLLGSPAAAGSARGTFSIQVRDLYDPLGDGTSWNWRTALTAINTGNVGIGQTNPSTYKLDVTGTIRATGDVIAYSDIRVKENIKTIDNALDKVKALRGVEYNKIDNPEKSIGVIAQEIEEVIPEVVREDDQGMKSVAYGNITAVLIEAIKEQQKQIDELKSIINGSSG